MSNLQVIANDMLPVLENEQGEKFVDAGCFMKSF